ncbi:hypothetical protein ACEPAI_4429 [Sanghuangporus weigelae]
MDVVSFITDIPSTVEGFVKTARLLVTYRGIEEKYAETIEDAIYYADKLVYLTNFIDGARLSVDSAPVTGNQQSAMWNKALTRAGILVKQMDGPRCINEDLLPIESQQILFNLFQRSISALKIAHKIILEWAIRLDLVDASTARILLAKLSLSISDRLMRLPQTEAKRSSFAKMRNKLALLSLGCVQIEDAMGRLKHWLSELHDILLASPQLHSRVTRPHKPTSKMEQDEDDDILFVAIARNREEKGHLVRCIEDDLFKSARLLDLANPDLFYINKGQWDGCLIDRRIIEHFLEEGKGHIAIKDTERMARLFAEEYDDLGHNISASIGVLPCCGYSNSQPEYHDLVFRLPPNCQVPLTLRRLLLEEPHHSLEERIRFSIKLASAVLVVHSLGILHKDIRPDSIVLLRSATSHRVSRTLGDPFLVSFNQFRFQGSRSIPLTQADREGRSVLWQALYRHPRHLCTQRHVPSETRDDIFSLGICLLEIAIWKSLFAWNEEAGVLECDKEVLDFSDEKYFMGELADCEYLDRELPYYRLRDLKAFAEEMVPITMGSAFKDIVVDCLTFGEEDPRIADMAQRQKDNVAFLKNQSVNFVQRILTKLKNLKVK